MHIWTMITFNPTERHSTLALSSPLHQEHKSIRVQAPMSSAGSASDIGSAPPPAHTIKKAITHSSMQPSSDVHHSIAHDGMNMELKEDDTCVAHVAEKHLPYTDTSHFKSRKHKAHPILVVTMSWLMDMRMPRKKRISEVSILERAAGTFICSSSLHMWIISIKVHMAPRPVSCKELQMN